MTDTDEMRIVAALQIAECASAASYGAFGDGRQFPYWPLEAIRLERIGCCKNGDASSV